MGLRFKPTDNDVFDVVRKGQHQHKYVVPEKQRALRHTAHPTIQEAAPWRYPRGGCAYYGQCSLWLPGTLDTTQREITLHHAQTTKAVRHIMNVVQPNIHCPACTTMGLRKH